MGVPERISRIASRLLASPYRLSLAVAILVLLIKLIIVNIPSPEPGKPNSGFIFDEKYYVEAARSLLGRASANEEHPPIVKMLVAVSMMFFGDNPVGWRMPSILSSTLAVWLIGVVAYELSASRRASALASAFFAADVLSFNLGSIAVLEASTMAFVLAATVMLLRGRHVYGALFLGIALLSKVTAILAVFSLMFYLLIVNVMKHGSSRAAIGSWLRILERVAIITTLVFLAGLTAYDYMFNAFPTPFDHIGFMLRYHASLKIDDPSQVIYPISWANPFALFSPMPFYVLTAWLDGREWHPVAFWGVSSPLWWMTWIVVFFTLYTVASQFKAKSVAKVEAFSLMWLIFNYFTYFLVAHLLNRWVYPFYFYTSIPALCVSVPHILREEHLPRFVLYLLLAAQLTWLFIWFPVKTPEYARLLYALGLRP